MVDRGYKDFLKDILDAMNKVQSFVRNTEKISQIKPLIEKVYEETGNEKG